MARRIIWAPKASRDFLGAIDFIEVESKEYAKLVATRILKRVEALSEMTTGKPGRVVDTYEVYVPRANYLIAYELPDKGTIHILRVIHAKRNRPEGEWPRD
jgi:toxin ParE1/3/4